MLVKRREESSLWERKERRPFCSCPSEHTLLKKKTTDPFFAGTFVFPPLVEGKEKEVILSPTFAAIILVFCLVVLATRFVLTPVVFVVVVFIVVFIAFIASGTVSRSVVSGSIVLLASSVTPKIYRSWCSMAPQSLDEKVNHFFPRERKLEALSAPHITPQNMGQTNGHSSKVAGKKIKHIR